jgi:lysophospholipase L1-like esterase
MRIALVGDSHTQITFPLLRDKLEGEGHQVVLEESKPGWTARKFLSNGIADRLAEVQPEATIFSLGANNYEREDTFGGRVSQIVGAARAAGSKKVIWIGPPTTNAGVRPDIAKNHERTSGYLIPLASELSLIFVDPRPYTLTGQRDDGVHFTRAAYADWVDSMWSDIKRSLSLPLALASPYSWMYWALVPIPILLLAWAVRRRLR